MSQALLSNNPDEDIEPISPFGAVDYGVTEEELAALAAKYEGIQSIETRKQFDAAQAAVTVITRARTDLEKRRKTLKSDALGFGRLVDSRAKELTAVLEPEEGRLRELLDVVKAKKAEEKAERERVEKERVDGILVRIEVMSKMPADLHRAPSADVAKAIETLKVSELTEELYQEFLERAFDVKHQVLAELEDLRFGALHDEQIAKRERKEREQKEVEQKAEAERLAQERADLEEKQRVVDEDNARKQAALDEQQRQVEEQRREMEVEQQRIADEKQAELERQEREQAAKDEAEKTERLDTLKREHADRIKPDREKIEQFVGILETLERPALTTEEGIQSLDQVNAIIHQACVDLQTLAARL